MASSSVKIDTRGLRAFSKRLGKMANGELRKKCKLWLEAMGMEFLGIVQDEIIRLEVVDTRRLLNSFGREDGECVFEMSDNKLSLRVGTQVLYAAWVNDGHWTTPEGVESRWVPGKWTDDRFEYDRTSNEGMLLKRKWVEGRHYFDISITMFEKIMNVSLDKNVQKWLDVLGSGSDAPR